MLAALAAQRTVYPATAVIVGTGPDEAEFKRLAQKLGIEDKVSFAGSVPARTAFARGRCVVVPSRAESFPYVVLEAAAAQMPLIATEVGGIPEIVEGTDTPLIRPGDIAALAQQMRAFLAHPKPFLGRAIQLQRHVANRLTVERMTREIVDFYISTLGVRLRPRPYREGVVADERSAMQPRRRHFRAEVRTAARWPRRAGSSRP